MAEDFITCPRCGWTSFNKNDVEQRYCGNCHMFHDDMLLLGSSAITSKENSMTPLCFKPELFHLLKWFTDSPDTGDPACLCSYCGKVIEDDFDDDKGNGEIALRMWRGVGKDTQELRLHMDCARLVIIGWSSPDQEYIHHPAFAEGQDAFKKGWKRVSNPYDGTGVERYCQAWFAGWDDAWTKRES